MKVQKLIGSICTAATVLLLLPAANAEITIDTVIVGNPGNAADPLNSGAIPGIGSVGYTYDIGKYEVTNSQYTAFLNSVAKTDTYNLYNSSLSSLGITQGGSGGSYTYSVTSGLENRPVVYVTWFDAARFTNWLSNGQKTGAQDNTTTEAGAYTLNGAMSGIITKNALAQWYIPSGNEWYKAAYYNGSTGTYSLFPNGRNTITTADANYNYSVGKSTNVGTYASAPSSYGTLDQGGNAWEWNDDVFNGAFRGVRGGSWYYGDSNLLESSYQTSVDPAFKNLNVGFRVATSEVEVVPEPSSFILMGVGLGGIGLMRKFRRRR